MVAQSTEDVIAQVRTEIAGYDKELGAIRNERTDVEEKIIKMEKAMEKAEAKKQREKEAKKREKEAKKRKEAKNNLIFFIFCHASKVLLLV
jgi:hypothetical protein